MLKKALPIILIATLLHSNSNAQGLAINTTGAQTNASALLDVSSSQKGILIPRMTMVQRDAIVSPATGLMIYQTDNNAGYWYFDGVIWRTFVSNTVTSNNSIGFKAVRSVSISQQLNSGLIIYDSVTFNDGNYYDNSNTIVLFLSNDSPAGIDCFFTFPTPITFTFSFIFSKSATASIPAIPFKFGITFISDVDFT